MIFRLLRFWDFFSLDLVLWYGKQVPSVQGLLNQVSVSIMNCLRINSGHQIELLHHKVAPKVPRIVLSALISFSHVLCHIPRSFTHLLLL